jgi:hypothetical protein
VTVVLMWALCEMDGGGLEGNVGKRSGFKCGNAEAASTRCCSAIRSDRPLRLIRSAFPKAQGREVGRAFFLSGRTHLKTTPSACRFLTGCRLKVRSF